MIYIAIRKCVLYKMTIFLGNARKYEEMLDKGEKVG